MCAVSYKFVSICSKLFANPGTTRNIPGLFSDWFSFDKNSIDPLEYNGEFQVFFLFGARKSMSWIFCGWRCLGFDGATQEVTQSVTVEDSLIFIEISVQKSKDATWVQTSAKPVMQLQCTERIFPKLQAITHGSYGASFNLWGCITWKKESFQSWKKKLLNSNIRFSWVN